MILLLPESLRSLRVLEISGVTSNSSSEIVRSAVLHFCDCTPLEYVVISGCKARFNEDTYRRQLEKDCPQVTFYWY